MSKIGYNIDWARTVSRAQFVEAMNLAYPGIDHGASYDEMFPKVEPVQQEPSPAPSPEPEKENPSEPEAPKGDA